MTRRPKLLAAGQLAGATLIWLAIGLSLGWYYTFTYCGKVGWPMPLIEPCAGLLLYYFSVINASTEIQAVHWMATFPVAGALWPLALLLTAWWMKLAPPGFARLFWRLSLGLVPMALAGPWMAWVAGAHDGAFSWHTMVQVALRRDFVEPWASLSPLYLALGLAGLAIQIWQYRRCFPLPAKQAWQHYLLSAIVLVLMAGLLGELAGHPLRAWLE